jgi:hypothetical protein
MKRHLEVLKGSGIDTRFDKNQSQILFATNKQTTIVLHQKNGNNRTEFVNLEMFVQDVDSI